MAHTFGPQQKHPKIDNYLSILSVEICNVTDKGYNQSKKFRECFTLITIKFERTKGHICFNGCVFWKCNRALYFRIIL